MPDPLPSTHRRQIQLERRRPRCNFVPPVRRCNGSLWPDEPSTSSRSRHRHCARMPTPRRTRSASNIQSRQEGEGAMARARAHPPHHIVVSVALGYALPWPTQYALPYYFANSQYGSAITQQSGTSTPLRRASTVHWRPHQLLQLHRVVAACPVTDTVGEALVRGCLDTVQQYPPPPHPSSMATEHAMMNIINDDGEFQRVEDPYSSVLDVQTKKRRGASYSTKEDELLCLAWLDTSIVSLTRLSVQSKGGGAPFWRRVHAFFAIYSSCGCRCTRE